MSERFDISQAGVVVESMRARRTATTASSGTPMKKSWGLCCLAVGIACSHATEPNCYTASALVALSSFMIASNPIIAYHPRIDEFGRKKKKKAKVSVNGKVDRKVAAKAGMHEPDIPHFF